MRTLLFVVGMVAAVGGTASAQITTAQISGTVLDSQTLAVAGAQISAQNEATGEEFSTRSNEVGNYTLPALPVGRYTVKVELAGFKQYTRTGIVLTANQVARVDIALEVGSVSESVKVVAELSTVNTATSTLDTMIDDRRLVDLPLNGRNALSLASLTPGIQRSSLSNGPSFGQQAINVNGNRSYATNIMLDGATLYYAHRGQGLIEPPPDAVQEIKVITSGVTAEFGRGSAVISAVTRGGTNEYHGSLWNYFRNDMLDARSFFSASVPKLRYNQFGGTGGGPIRHNKAFFFGSYQRLEQRGDRVASSAFPPTADERNGDFSKTPGTKPVDPSNNNQPFPGAIIPKTRFDPVAVKLAERFPLPNRPDGTYLAQRSVATTSDMFLGRVDYDFGPGDRTTARYFMDKPAQDNPFPANSNVDTYASSATGNRTQNAGVSHTHTFSPSLLLNVRLSYTRFRYYETNAIRTTLADLGAKFITGGGPGSLPLLTIGGRMAAESAREGPRVSDTHEAGADMSWFHGRHEVKYGFSAQRVRFMIGNSGRSYGEFQFTGNYTKSSMADFFIGQAAQLRQETAFDLDSRYWAHAYFVQDRWRASRRLTLNFGLRWEVYQPWRAKGGKNGALVPGQQSKVFPTAPLGLVYEADEAYPVQLDAVNPGPRVGFAWDVFGNGRTSIRGGYGIGYDPLIGQSGAAQNVQPLGADVLTTNVGPLTDPQRFITVPYGRPLDRANPVFILPITMTKSFVGKFVTPYTQNINFTIEHEIVRGTMLQTSYVGTLGRHLSSASEQDPAVYIPGKSTLQNVQSRRIYNPTFGSSIGHTTSAISDYHALQVVASRRLASGFSLMLSYSYAKAIDEVSTSEVADNWWMQDPYNRRGERSRGDYDIRHRMVASWLWELPILRAQKGVAGKLFGGWQLSGIASFRTGTPFSVNSGVDRSLTGVGHDRPNSLGNAELPSGRPRADMIRRFFDTTKFVLNNDGEYGNSGRNILSGPGGRNWDLSLHKKTALWSERTRLEVRWDVFSAFNQPSFGGPGTSFSSASSFGRITSAGGSRVMQLGARIEF